MFGRARLDQRTIGVVLALVFALGSPLPAAATSASGDQADVTSDLLPDLAMPPLYDMYLRESRKGNLNLRFGSIVWNLGRGPLEVRASGRSGRTMTIVKQVISTSDGSRRKVLHPDATAFYAGDGHDHWHLPGFVVVTLVALPTPENPAPSETRRLRKIGFCLTDLVRVPADIRPPGSAPTRQYPYTGCGGRRATKIKMGIAVGWGDDYKPSIAYQVIDVTGLPVGDYQLCATANPDGEWTELDYLNNSTWTTIHLEPVAMTVTELEHGAGACPVTVI